MQNDIWDEKSASPISAIEAAVAVAKSLGKDDAAALFASAAAVSAQGELSVVLPAGRLESLKHGKGWARLGSHDAAVWGVKTEGGYRVNRPGRWIVGCTDGFSRKREDAYKVARVKIGDLFWIVAHPA